MQQQRRKCLYIEWIKKTAAGTKGIVCKNYEKRLKALLRGVNASEYIYIKMVLKALYGQQQDLEYIRPDR